MNKEYFLGIDISTTATKAILIDTSGNVIAESASTYTFETPQPLWSEQDPALWWQAAQKSIWEVIQKSGTQPDKIKGIGLTGQMHGLVLLDGSGEVLRPAILWNDQRTQSQCDAIHQRIGRDRFIQTSGNVALTGFTAPKILWVAENEPEIYARIRHILLPKDYVRFCLTGEYASDKAGASGTVLFDLEKRDWSPMILDSLSINREWLPETYEGPENTGPISKTAAHATGLVAGTPVVAGGGDQAAQAVGVGAVEPGIIGLTLGTSGVIFATTPRALVESEGRLHAFCHAVPNTWHFMGVMLSAAGSLQWYRDQLAPGMDFNRLNQEARQISAGCDGLQFLPYLSGERTPYPDPNARGAFIGLTVRHTHAHMTRSVLEGVAFGFKDIFLLLQHSGVKEIKQIRVSGGGAKSSLWREILASVLDIELVTVNTTEGAAYGAALLAGVGTGTWSDIPTACQQTIKITGYTSPSLESIEAYQKAYAIFSNLYPALTSIFQKMK